MRINLPCHKFNFAAIASRLKLNRTENWAQNELSTTLPSSVVYATFPLPALLPFCLPSSWVYEGLCAICCWLCAVTACSKWIFKSNVCKCVASFALNKSKIFARALRWLNSTKKGDWKRKWSTKRGNERENEVRFKVVKMGSLLRRIISYFGYWICNQATFMHLSLLCSSN